MKMCCVQVLDLASKSLNKTREKKKRNKGCEDKLGQFKEVVRINVWEGRRREAAEMEKLLLSDLLPQRLL